MKRDGKCNKTASGNQAFQQLKAGDVLKFENG